MGIDVKRKPRSRGIAVLLTSVMLIGAVAIVGLAVDVGMMYAIKTKLSAAVDAAALAGARAVGNSGTSGAASTASAYFNANMTNGYMLAQNISANVTGPTSSGTTTTMTVTGQAQLPLMFLRVLTLLSPSIPNNQTINMSATAVRQNVNMVIVLDRSGSMNSVDPTSSTGQTACQEMVSAAQSFTDNYVDGTDELGLIVFGGSYKIAYAMNKNFKSGSPTIKSVIGTITCGGNTGSAQAISQATTMLNGLSSTVTSGALNVITFFTDGQPNGLAADWPIMTSAYLIAQGWKTGTKTVTAKNTPQVPNSAGNPGGAVTPYPTTPWYLGYAPSGCSATTAISGVPTISGVIARNGEDQNGIYGMSTTSIGADAGTVSASTGCIFGGTAADTYGQTGRARIHEDVAYIPTTDHYGNSTTGYWDSYFVKPNVTGWPFNSYPTIDYYATGNDAQGNPNGLFQNNIDIASMNAAESAATSARTNSAFSILIMAIGLGGAADSFPTSFLDHVSNDTDSDVHSTSQPTGQFIEVTGPGQLGSAFQSIASYVQRLTT
jgi:Flp pilus assembly protein TadG